MLVTLDVLSGVAPFAVAEVGRRLADAKVGAVRETEVEIEGDGLDDLRALRTVVAANLTLSFRVARPRELLSSDRMRDIAEAVATIRRQKPRLRFGSFRLSAAGTDSPELQRFRDEFATLTGLTEDAEDGDMLVRVRRDPDGPAWQVLLRTTPRPLSARAWRVANYPGALNATIAASIVDMLEPRPDDRVLDLMCGSGTLVLEWLARERPAELVACDISPVAIGAAEQNQRASRLKGRIDFLTRDFRSLSGNGFTALMANPPWGELVGSHDENTDLYRDLLAKAHALAARDARFAVLTHDIKRFDRVLSESPHWRTESVTRFFAKGHHPRCYRLRPL